MYWLKAWIRRVALEDVADREAAMAQMCETLRTFRTLLGTVYDEVAQTQAAVDVLLARCQPERPEDKATPAQPRPPREFTTDDRQTGVVRR